MVQDYHLFLVPRMLRDLRPDVRIGLFTHTPWVPPDYFAMLPDDVAHAHRRRHARRGRPRLPHRALGPAVPRHCAGEMDVDVADDCVQVFPLGTDPDEMIRLGRRRDVDSALRVLNDSVGDRLVIGRVDRTELSKNVWRGLLAYRELLRTRPEWRDRVVHAVFNNPSREDLPGLPRVHRAHRAAGRGHRRRVRHRRVDAAHLRHRRRLPGRARDPAPQRRPLRQLGARRHEPRRARRVSCCPSATPRSCSPARPAPPRCSATDALTVNPFDVSATAAALHEALLMPADERAPRAARMRDAAVQLPPDAVVPGPARRAPLDDRAASSATRLARGRDRYVGRLPRRARRRSPRRRRRRRRCPSARSRRISLEAPGMSPRSSPPNNTARSVPSASRRRAPALSKPGSRSSSTPLPGWTSKPSSSASAVTGARTRPGGGRIRGLAGVHDERQPLVLDPHRRVGAARRATPAAAPAARPSAPACPGSSSSPSVHVSMPYSPATTTRGRPRARRAGRTVCASRPVMTATCAPRPASAASASIAPSAGRESSGSGRSGASVPSKSVAISASGRCGRSAAASSATSMRPPCPTDHARRPPGSIGPVAPRGRGNLIGADPV